MVEMNFAYVFDCLAMPNYIISFLDNQINQYSQIFGWLVYFFSKLYDNRGILENIFKIEKKSCNAYVYTNT